MHHALFIVLVTLFSYSPSPPTAPTGRPLHSHNDYWRRDPLLVALKAGCISIEADVFAHGDHLAVAHDRRKITDKKTLTSMYLEPLAHIVRERQRVYLEDARPIILMIDIKSSWDETLPVLKKVLKPFRDVLHAPAGTFTGDGGIIITTSGAGAGRKRLSDNVAAIDGRPDDLGQGIDPKVMPVISLSFRSRYTWSMKEPLPKDELKDLISLAQRAREEGKLLRLWGAPDYPAMWDLLIDNGVGLINTDQPTTATKYLKNRESTK